MSWPIHLWLLISLLVFKGQAINICPTREITASSGQIRSPNYPSNYPWNTDCTLTIKQPLDTKFTFTFTKLDIEGDEDGGQLSCYDSLTISGGSSKEFCATTIPAPFVPGLNVVTLKMITDGSVQQSGFDLNFTTVQTTGLPPAVSVCPTRSITPSAIGRVHSPGFAGNYGAYLNCKLTLNVPSNKEVEISYNHRDIEYAPQCSKDKLTVADNSVSRYTCYASTGSPATYYDGNVSFHFTTDGSGSGSGFILTYKLSSKSQVSSKICDKPILKNVTTSLVFSGSGSSNYNNARFSSSGWCASGSTPYLLIDLQKEYHITRVVVMGDRGQTRWSESYSLKYSHNKTLVDGSSTVQITGNQNGSQASTTIVDIYNVRHIKIQSTGSAIFCLRIELCGEVQMPAPVYDIEIIPSDYSARVTWKQPTNNSTSSYITQIVIYLNGAIHQYLYIPRDPHIDITGLKPYTTYTVGIETGDGSSQKSSIVSKNFTTNATVPSGPPLNVTFTYRSKYSLNVSWRAPHESLWNGKLTGYLVCYSNRTKANNPRCTGTIKALTYAINNMQPSTKYFVTVSAVTCDGVGPKSKKISKITNGEPVSPVVMSYSNLSLSLTITKPASYIREVIVIVQIAKNCPTSSENIQTKELKPYQTNTQDPYVTAYLKADVLPLTFVIGDGKEYDSEKQKYFNQPLKKNSKYIVFLRFFESQNSYYSTEWSSSIKTIVNLRAPVNPLTTSYYTLSLNIPKPANYTREVMVIVQIVTNSRTPSENIQTKELKPYQTNTQDPYITAYLKSDVIPLTFVIGDGKEYNSEEENYFNQPLKQNSSYIVFLRFFESQDSYYSTEWSNSVKTMAKPPVECLCDSETSEKSSEDKKIRMDLLIPLVILALCFLLSLAVIIYQRRKASHKAKFELTGQEFSTYMSMEDTIEHGNFY